MKRLVTLFSIIIFCVGNLFAQWEAFPEYSDFLYEEYGVEIEVFFSEEYGYLGFVDEYPQRRFDVSRTVSFILNSFEYFIDFVPDAMEEYGIEGIVIYLVVEPDFSTKSSEEVELQIDLEEDWLYEYYSASSRARSDLLLRELNSYF